MFTEKRHVKTECWQGINELKIRSIRQTEEVLVNGLDFISKLVDTRHCMLSRLLVDCCFPEELYATNRLPTCFVMVVGISSWPSNTKRRPSK